MIFTSKFIRQILAELEDIRASLTDGTEATQEASLGDTRIHAAVLDGLDDLATALASFVDISYVFPAIDFGTVAGVEVINGPTGKRGVIKAVTVTNVTEAFTATTTPARVDFGDGNDADYYALSASLATTGIAASLSPAISAGVGGNLIPADAALTVTPVAPTGGTPAGIADVTVTIRWFT